MEDTYWEGAAPKSYVLGTLARLPSQSVSRENACISMVETLGIFWGERESGACVSLSSRDAERQYERVWRGAESVLRARVSRSMRCADGDPKV